MFRFLIGALLVLALGSLLTAAPVPARPKTAPTYIDLAPHANAKLKENVTNFFKNNDLGSLPTGKQIFAGVKFNVGDGLIQLASSQLKGRPTKVENIKVGRTLVKLHFLHACRNHGGSGEVIGKYVIHYGDNSTAEVEVAYGKDVVDWWVKPGEPEPTRAKVAWEGENDAAKMHRAKIQLFLTTWENPHPSKKVVSLDYVATAPERPVAPFCVAITAEDK